MYVQLILWIFATLFYKWNELPDVDIINGVVVILLYLTTLFQYPRIHRV
jgi:hypothetical protein